MQEICYKIVIDRCNQLQEHQRVSNRSFYKEFSIWKNASYSGVFSVTIEF